MIWLNASEKLSFTQAEIGEGKRAREKECEGEKASSLNLLSLFTPDSKNIIENAFLKGS